LFSNMARRFRTPPDILGYFPMGPSTLLVVRKESKS
jgi:hypothetical protein